MLTTVQFILIILLTIAASALGLIIKFIFITSIIDYIKNRGE